MASPPTTPTDWRSSSANAGEFAAERERARCAGGAGRYPTVRQPRGGANRSHVFIPPVTEDRSGQEDATRSPLPGAPGGGTATGSTTPLRAEHETPEESAGAAGDGVGHRLSVARQRYTA